MSASLPNGTILSVAASYGTDKAMSVLTNANPGVATLEAAHAIVVGDVFEITSGWPVLDGRIARASAVSTNDVTVEGIDTTSTTIYPAGAGIGHVREILTWTPLSQILTSQSQGGVQNFVDFQFLEASVQKRLPTVKTALGMTLDIADDATLAFYTLLRAADQDRLVRAVRAVLPTGAVIYYNAIISFNDNPTLDINNVMKVNVALSFNAPLTRYAS